MRSVLRPLTAAISIALGVSTVPSSPSRAGQTTPRNAEEAIIVGLLNDYLAHTGDPKANERFWADDLIYTDSLGNRNGKKDVLESVVAARNAPPSGKTFTHEAEDVRINLRGDTAVVAFRLLAHITEAGKTTTKTHMITGVFRRARGEWRAVAWGPTNPPPPVPISRP